jgi:hypothetical protein
LTRKKEGEEVAISSLSTLQLFKHQGRVFSKRKVTGAGIKALSIKGNKLIMLSPETLVTPVLEEKEVGPEPGEAEVVSGPGEAEAGSGEAEVGPEETSTELGEAEATPEE